ncbi:MAG: NAD(P)-dependent alcohol dehydrogenase, partial [Candidatus Kariarchaeaceae archaeon]
MKAVVYRKYGLPDVLQIEEIDKPIPKKNQVLVKIYATTVTPSDLMLRSGKFPLLFW